MHCTIGNGIGYTLRIVSGHTRGTSSECWVALFLCNTARSIKKKKKYGKKERMSPIYPRSAYIRGCHLLSNFVYRGFLSFKALQVLWSLSSQKFRRRSFHMRYAPKSPRRRETSSLETRLIAAAKLVRDDGNEF